MNPQRQQRRSSEVRGCLLRNFLDMRKRSLIRSESEDSGFSLESYEPFMNSSFDAEKFLEELGFSGDNAPLIPDRFIPSLIHRISNMPDETVLKLDTRVWNSIDSFKKKESTLWFFTQSSVECDLCINDLQRSYSLPAEFEQGICDPLYPDNGICAMGNSSNSAYRVQNWLHRFTSDSLSVGDKTKANIGYIGNQSSTESGILSALSDDEAYTTTNCIEGFGVNSPPKWVDDLEWSKSKVLSLKPTPRADFEERPISKTIAKSTPSDEISDYEALNVSTAFCLGTVPSDNEDTLKAVSSTGVFTSEISPVQKGERRCLDKSHDNENSFSLLDRIDPAEGNGHCKSVGGNVNKFASRKRKLAQGNLNIVQTCGQVTKNLDSGTENFILSTEDSNCHYVNGDVKDSLQDFNNSIRRVSTPKPTSVANFDGTKKRHSFDSAYLTADEKRRRFRHSHSKTHNALFEKRDSRPSASRLNETTANLTTVYDSDIFHNSQEETEVKHSDQLKPKIGGHNTHGVSQNGGNSSTFSDTLTNVDILPHSGSIADNPSEVSDTDSNIDIGRHIAGNLDSPSEVYDVDSNVDTGRHIASNLESPSEVSDTDSDADIEHHIANNLDSPSEVYDVDSNVDTGRHIAGNLESPSEVSDTDSDVDIERHIANNLDSPSEVYEVDSNVDTGRHIAGNLESPSEVSDTDSDADIERHIANNLDSPSEVYDVDSNVDTGSHIAGNLHSPSEVYDTDCNVDTRCHIVGNLDSPSELSDIDSNVDIAHHIAGNLDSRSEVSDIDSNVNIRYHDGDLDIKRHNAGSLDTPLEVSGIVNNLESNADIERHNTGSLDTPLEVSDIVNNVEQFMASEVLSISDSESSEQYFSCDELSTTKTPVDDDFMEHDCGEEKKEIPIEPVRLFPCLTAEQRLAAAKMTSHVLSRDAALFRNCNRSTYAKYNEHFILNKILKRSLQFSVLRPVEKMSRHFPLENDRTDNETFSQILNSPSSSLKSKVLEKHAQSVTYGKSASREVLLNFSSRKKSVGSITGDKAEELDNNISQPFVHNLSLTSEMRSPKCEVRFINYDGLALFWAARNTAAGNISCDSGFGDSVNTNMDNTINRRFVSGIHMDVNSENESDNKVYFNEVRLEVNTEENKADPENERPERCVTTGEFQSGNTGKEVHDKDFSISKRPANAENPCGRALKDLEDLKIAIRKAKETRMFASRELKLLQVLLHNGDSEEYETLPRRTTLAMSESKLSLPSVEIINGNIGKGKMMEALSEIQQKSTKEASQNKEIWEEEIRKAKEEISQVFHENLSIMEEKLHTTENELARALKENTRLKDQLELRSAALPVCKCNAEAQNHSAFSHMNGISDEDPKIISTVKPSVPTKNFWQEWDRLQSDLMKAERRADELNILLNQKLIELNRMQLTLSKQTKEMILLEKAYFQLRSHLSKRKLNKSSLSHQSSSAMKTQSSTGKASETSFKTTDPEIPP